MLKRYVIERDLPGVGQMNAKDLGQAAQTSNGALAKLSAPMRRVRASKPCSEYYAGHGTLLDHFFATRAFAELSTDATAEVSGVCGEATCRVIPNGERLQAKERLSDHCPVVLDVPDRDQD